MRRDDLVPSRGTTRPTYLEHNAGAIEVELTDDDLARSERYDEAGMASENLYPVSRSLSSASH